MTIDKQIEAIKTTSGISFAIKNGNHLEYVHIPTTKDQKFKYFYDPRKHARIRLFEEKTIKTLKNLR